MFKKERLFPHIKVSHPRPRPVFFIFFVQETGDGYRQLGYFPLGVIRFFLHLLEKKKKNRRSCP
ncbi:hypothetical protein Q2412_25375, partial [Escherichia coli]|nr:hypothetical protein [Escherichia coli]